MSGPKIPPSDSIQELARFWDTHDLTDFDDELEEVPEPVFESSTKEKGVAKMKVEPLPAERTENEQIEILKFVHQSQKTESLQHRQNLFNSFAAWAAILLAAIGAIIAIEPPSLLDKTLVKLSAGIVISALSILVVVFMWRQRVFSVEGLEIARDIEKRLGLFEKGRYWPCQSVLPDRFAQPLEKRPTASDWIQILVILILTVLVWFTLFAF